MSNLSILFDNKTASEVREASDKIVNLMKEGKIKNPSILDIASATLGKEGMRAFRDAPAEECFTSAKESINPVNLTAFTNITGQLVFQGVVESYKSPEFIGDQLMDQEISREDNTQEVGLALMEDDALEVKEGEQYPHAKFGEDYIAVPRSKKRGLACGVTREMVFFDRTGKVMEMAREVGLRLGTNREKRQLSVVLGINNSFVRKGVARNTYVATGTGDPRVNKVGSLDFVDWNTLDTAMQVFNDMNDDRAIAEPISVMPTTLLVTPSKQHTVNRVLNATALRTGSVAGNTQTYGDNPVKNVYNVLTSQWITKLLTTSVAATDSTTAYTGLALADAKKYWHLGDFKRTFRYRTLFPLNVRAAMHDVDEFERDVVAQFRADERGVAYVRAPWYSAQFYDT